MSVVLSSKFYVYEHKDPQTKEIIYIGSGSGSRAWSIGKTHRTAEHTQALETFLSHGYHLGHIVGILNWNMTKEEARKLEESKIKAHKPKFNRQGVVPYTYTSTGLMAVRKRMKGNTHVVGMKWWTNGVIDKRAFVTPGDGWFLGRTTNKNWSQKKKNNQLGAA